MVKGVADSFAARGREISGYQGSVAASVANQDVTRLLQDINEAQRLGDRYGKLIDSQTRFEGTLKAGLLPIKDFAIGKLTILLEAMLQAIQAGLEGLNQLTFGAVPILAEMAAEMKKARAGVPGALGGDPMRHWLGLARNLGLDPAPAAPFVPRPPCRSASPPSGRDAGSPNPEPSS